MIPPGRAHQLGVIGCHACGLVCEDTVADGASIRCPRCGAALHRRFPNSIARAWALLIASLIFYTPAMSFRS